MLTPKATSAVTKEADLHTEGKRLDSTYVITHFIIARPLSQQLDKIIFFLNNLIKCTHIDIELLVNITAVKQSIRCVLLSLHYLD